ncbi:PKD domain-containing protein [Candidatus Micrarchaeota archaeon]|nr:PKD domain-containing protein [Candidatus Micrarchaeota archaeon]
MKKLMFVLLALPLLFAQFSEIESAPSGKSAYITWKTDYNCTGKILYGKTESLGSSATNSTKSLSHGVKLSSLTPDTKYFYKLQCVFNSTTYDSEISSFTTPAVYPDLTITNVTSTPASTALGKNITIKTTVKNTGDEKATEVLLRVTCADGSSLTKTISSIGVGSSSTASLTCTPPSETGTQTISVSVDPENAITEKNEENNQGQVSVLYTAQPKPDLSISASDITYQIKEVSGEPSISLKIYVNNIGTEKATNVWVRANNKYAKISSISAGSKGYTTIVLPADETQIAITADPNGTISELNEENNRAELSISAESTLPDLYITDTLITHSPSTLKTGSTVTISAKIYNGGPVTAENVKVIFQKVDRIQVYNKEEEETEHTEIDAEALHSGIIADLIKEGKVKEERTTIIEGEEIGKATITSISPGANKVVKATFTIPADTTSITIAVTIDPENKIREKEEGNNIGTHPLAIEALYPDLTINTSNGITFSPADPEVGETLKVKAKIKNQGTLLAQNIPVQFYVSTDGGPFRLFQSKTIDKINAKSFKDLTVDWPVPTGAKSATFLVQVNPTGAISEKSLTNNAANKTINISLPDLYVQSLTSTGTVSVGSTVTVKAVVKNSGTAKATNAQIVFYYVTPSGDEREIGSKTATISSGGSTTQSIQWTVPTGISSNPIVMAKVNPSHSIYESDFGNNQGSLGLNAQLPDLTVSLSTDRPTVVIPTASDYYAYAHITASVHNVGNARANNIVVQIFSDGTKIKEETIPQLNAGASADVAGYIRVDRNYDPGTITFSATADPSNSVTETLDTNNDADITSTLADNQPPNAAIAVDKDSALRGEYFTFNCFDTTDPEGPYFSCEWRFDYSGEWEQDTEVYKYFTIPGQHLASLTVTDSGGATDTAQYIVTVQPNQNPVAILDGPYTAYKGETTWFSPHSSTDPDGGITSVYWTFGDGASLTESFDSVPHTYSSTGTYTLTMRVTDTDGATSTTSTTVTVVNAPPTTTKTGTEYFISHTYHSPWEAGPQATVYYGIYKVDYKVKYTTNDNVIRYLEYTISSGPAIVTQVTDNDAESLYQDLTATAVNGNTAMQVNGVEIRNDNTAVWSDSGGPHISGSETPRTMSYSGLEVPMAGTHNYVVVDMDITFPGDMCAAEQYDCQWQVAFWQIN